MIRKQVSKLPTEVRTELDQKIRAAGYGSYQAMQDWLQSLGYSIPYKTIAAYGKELQTADAIHQQKVSQHLIRVEAAVALAKQMATMTPDEADHLMGAIIAMTNTGLLAAMTELEEMADHPDPITRIKVYTGIAEKLKILGEASRGQKMYASDMIKLALSAGAEAVEQAAFKRGLPGDVVSDMRAALLGSLTTSE